MPRGDDEGLRLRELLSVVLCVHVRVGARVAEAVRV